jgi:hypothetical protein
MSVKTLYCCDVCNDVDSGSPGDMPPGWAVVTVRVDPLSHKGARDHHVCLKCRSTRLPFPVNASGAD